MSEHYLTVYASIGNSDDKLTQQEWSAFHEVFTSLIKRAATQVYGDWLSASNSLYQNACMGFAVAPSMAAALKTALKELAVEFKQDSIAWAEAAGTEFLTAVG